MRKCVWCGGEVSKPEWDPELCENCWKIEREYVEHLRRKPIAEVGYRRVDGSGHGTR